MGHIHDQLRDAWLDLVRAEDLARARATHLTDEWNVTAASLMRARLLLEEAGDDFGPVDETGAPDESCVDLVRSALSTMRQVPRDQEPAQLTLALLAVSDALRGLERRDAA